MRDRGASAVLPDTPDVVRVLVENHDRFLRFLERRLGSREEAEDLLQEAFVRGLARAQSVRAQESVVAWFYRLLRNAIIDHRRRQSAEARSMARLAGASAEERAEPADAGLMKAVCGCVLRLLETLKPEYGAALKAVDVDGTAVSAFAKQAGISASNAGVRLHRAREALRKQVIKSCGTCTLHECLDCTCGAGR